jgi:hypothetical protein
MKTTLVMLAALATVILTWMFVTFIFFMLSDPGVTFKYVARHEGMAMFMLIFGWIPSIIVGADINERLYAKI